MDRPRPAYSAASDIDFTYATASQQAFRRAFIRLIENMSGQRHLRSLYETYVRGPEPGDFFDTAIEKLNLDVVFDAGKLMRIPRGEPLIFIANHPFGVADGIVLTWLARKARPEVKVMANHVLCQAPEARKHLLPVDFSGTKDALLTNLETRRQALAALRKGGAIGLFPGGGVAASEKPWGGPAVDPHWHAFLAQLVRKSGAAVVPIYFDGQNSRLFQIASHTSYTLRLALFFRETHRLMGRAIRVEIGDMIKPQTLAAIGDKEQLLLSLRRATYSLAPPSKRNRKSRNALWEREFVYPAKMKF